VRRALDYLLLIVLMAVSNNISAQNSWIEGFVRDQNQMPLEFVSIAIQGTPTGTITNNEGYFKLLITPGIRHTILFSFIGFEQQSLQVELKKGERRNVYIFMKPHSTTLPDVEISEKHVISGQYIKIDPQLSAVIPGPGSGVENLLKTMPGVSSVNEMSSQYSVRGGNFDENLVYVNGIEIYRPFLVRSGQQEGLSFINSAMVSSITFSAGGFDAQYGDKMASVLDIAYKNPQAFAGSFSASLLEGSVHIEDALFNKRFTYLTGIRYKSNQYLLGTLDTKGSYQPQFSDLQSLISYQFDPMWSISFLGNYSRNQYLFKPEKQVTRFGTVTEVRQFTVFFEGQERDLFQTSLGAVSLIYQPQEDRKFQLISSLFQTDENENFDVRGQYLLERVETDFGSSGFGQPVGDPLGIGTFHNHARNYLNGIVWNIEHKGEIDSDDQHLKWGLKFQREDIYDRLSEWTLVDSAGFSLPQNPSHAIFLQDTVRTMINLITERFSGFIQNSWEIDRTSGRYILTTGVRASYWSFNRQWLFSPRATILFKPSSIPRLVIRLSGGLYQQQPFYKELRDFQGVLNENIKAQESLQLVAGAEYHLKLWDRPFKYISEIYFKKFNNLIPYELNNVRIRYYASNQAHGYGAGVDMKINGEFVPGVESWASFSLMKTEEVIEGAYYIDREGNQIPLGYAPRPTDQRMAFNLFFQDFLPKNPSYKVSLALVFGSGLPTSPPSRLKFKDPVYMPPYRRVDIGFSKELIGSNSKSEKRVLKHFNSMWISAEVFNLLQINNTISYQWIRDISGNMFAIPNYLTTRLVNIKLTASF
jgi:hypothetical protein